MKGKNKKKQTSKPMKKVQVLGSCSGRKRRRDCDTRGNSVCFVVVDDDVVLLLLLFLFVCLFVF